MRSIERRFVIEQEKNPLASTFICFTNAVKNQNFTPAILRKWFNKLVDKEDYDKKDKRQILTWLLDLTLK